MRSHTGGRVVGRVKEIHRFPVKSMVGERLERAALHERGVPSDRIWALRDLDRDEIASAKRIPALLRCRARFIEGGNVEIELPSGRLLRSDDPDVSQLLSSELERSLRLEPLAPASNRRHYRTAALRTPSDLRRYLGVRKGGTLPDMSEVPIGMLAMLSIYATPPGTYFDLFPLHLVTTTALRTLSRAIGQEVASERFRPNIVIDTSEAEDGYPELAWNGALAIGDASIHLRGATFRCAMPSHAQASGIAKAPSVVRTIYDELDSKFGVYASVSTPGSITVGDPVVLSPLPSSAIRDAVARHLRPIKRRLLDAYVGFGRAPSKD